MKCTSATETIRLQASCKRHMHRRISWSSEPLLYLVLYVKQMSWLVLLYCDFVKL